MKSGVGALIIFSVLFSCQNQGNEQVTTIETIDSSLKQLFSREELVDMNFPFGKYGADVPLGDPDVEWKRSNPDILVYVPTGSGIYNGDNEHFLVFEAPHSDELLALWTQSSVEGSGNNHLVLTRSSNVIDWSEPEFLVGSQYGSGGLQASWGFPIVTSTGRIYIFYTKQIEVSDNSPQLSGTMGCIYSDDNGYNWTAPEEIPMPDPGLIIRILQFRKTGSYGRNQYWTMKGNGLRVIRCGRQMQL